MLNSWPELPPTGFLSGTLTHFGDYDQCLNIPPNPVIDTPQYCLIDISLPLPKPIGSHHSFYHIVNVLPPKLNNSVANNNDDNVFVKFSKNASFFYWMFIRLGICVPNKCLPSDVHNIAYSEKVFRMKTVLNEPLNQPFLQAYYSVETFFFVSS
ncbi:unnamed protein product [Oppiella nova]|uniref:Nose resistant-to-fluoxetine protein N-terminal domain-containing protein n=1 Tax=Oppiella nova TaxID=334625 RepID=A0A7R9LL14_9ACAR|nr:unnamed protein product [Oppiella nova]CAG2164033.1 unnamed protein product [Oppiella nova]